MYSPDGLPREAIRILIASDHKEHAERLRILVQQGFLPMPMEVIGSIGTRHCLQHVSDHHPNVVLYVTEDAQVPETEISRTIHQQYPGTAVIVLTTPERQENPGYLRQALLTGARDVLAMPPMLDTLMSSIEQAYKLERDRRPARAMWGYRADATPAGGQLIVVYSAKGGTGRSVVAANLAAFIARRNQNLRVTLFDLDLQFGDQRILFNLDTRNSFLDLLPVIDELSRDVMDATLVTHPSGVRVLLAPEQLPQADLIDAQSVHSVLSKLRVYDDVIVVDAPTYITDITLTAFEFADHIVTVCTPDVLTIRRTRVALDLFDGLGIPRHLVGLVLNRVNKQCEIRQEDFHMLFEHEILAAVPDDYFFLEPYVNVGTLLTEAPDSAAVVKIYEQLAKELTPRIVGG